MKAPSCTIYELEIGLDMAFVVNKLGVELETFRAILDLPDQSYGDYPSHESLFKLKDCLVSWLRGRG